MWYHITGWEITVSIQTRRYIREASVANPNFTLDLPITVSDQCLCSILHIFSEHCSKCSTRENGDGYCEKPSFVRNDNVFGQVVKMNDD